MGNHLSRSSKILFGVKEALCKETILCDLKVKLTCVGKNVVERKYR